MYDVVIFLLAFFGSLFLSSLLTYKLIPFLRAKKMGQSILVIGPVWHKSKEGTPTMGGAVFLFVIPVFSLLTAFLLGAEELFPLVLVLLFALACGGIGLIDDSTKLKNKENQGLFPWQKLVLQVSSATAFLYFFHTYATPLLPLQLPFWGVPIGLGFAAFFVLLFIAVGVVNCANLTDGIDGLAGSVAFIIGVHFFTEGLLYGKTALALLGLSLSGTVLGFLFFNLHPAKIFMGDTGSLFLGALITGGAFLMERPLSLLLYGVVYILEGISVVLQVLVYKRTRRRLFLMAPLHHHFEKRGWSENKLVICAVLLSAVGAFLSHIA